MLKLDQWDKSMQKRKLLKFIYFKDNRLRMFFKISL